MTKAQLAETFVCDRLRANLTRASCATRHRPRRKRSSPRRDLDAAVVEACADCAIGAQHARGEAAEVVRLVALRATRPPPPVPVRYCLVCAEPISRSSSKTCSLACSSDWGTGGVLEAHPSVGWVAGGKE
jgi:hypothetical protein